MKTNKKRCNFILDTEIVEKARDRAAEQRRSLTKYIEILIEEDVKKHLPEKKKD